MLLHILHMIADFAVLVARLTTEELADEQRIALIDQFIRLQGVDAAIQFDLHDLLMILITLLIIIFWRAWDRADGWP
jgi:SHS2 domain-containing protein